MRHPQNNSARLTQVVDAVYCDLLIWRCRSLLFSCNPRLRQYVGASFRYCGFAFQFLFRPVAIKVRFSYVQFRSPPNTSWKATYKLFPIFGPKRKKKAMCNLNIPQTSFQRWYVVGEVQILLSGKKYSVILTSPINTPHFSSILRFTNIINSLNFNIWCTNSTGRESTTYEPKL